MLTHIPNSIVSSLRTLVFPALSQALLRGPVGQHLNCVTSKWTAASGFEARRGMSGDPDTMHSFAKEVEFKDWACLLLGTSIVLACMLAHLPECSMILIACAQAMEILDIHPGLQNVILQPDRRVTTELLVGHVRAM